MFIMCKDLKNFQLTWKLLGNDLEFCFQQRGRFLYLALRHSLFCPTAHQDNFHYLNQGESPYVNGVDDAECLEETREAMELLGISEDDQIMIFRILAAILHLGNVDIQPSGEEESMIAVRNVAMLSFKQ